MSRPRAVTEADLALFAGLTGDRRASGPGDPDPTTDADRTGPLVLAYAFGLLDLDPAEVAVSQLRETSFHRRLRPGDTIHLEGEVEMVQGDETIQCLWCVMRGDGKPIARFQTEFIVLTRAATDDPPVSAFMW